MGLIASRKAHFARQKKVRRTAKRANVLTDSRLRKPLKIREFTAKYFLLDSAGTLVKLTSLPDEYLYTSGAYLYKNRMTHPLPRHRQTPDDKSDYHNGVTYFHATLLRIATVYPTFCYINANHVIHS